VTSNVEPEEAEAIQALVDPAGERPLPAVAPRDFARPRRMSDRRLAEIQRQVQDCLPAIATEVLSSLRVECLVELEDVGELDCRDLISNLEFPSAVLCFDHSDLPGWAILDGPAAISAADCFLGAGVQDGASSRPLTTVEQALMCGFLGRILGLVTNALDMDVAHCRLAQTLDEVVLCDPSDLSRDSGRLYIHLHLNGGGLDTTLRVYLPAVNTGEAVATPEAAELNPSFSKVSVDVGVYLGCVDIPLNDLLNLEPGDVVPLGVDLEAPLRVYVEDRPCATARWGQHNGHLAIQIEKLGLEGDEYHELGLQQSQTND